MKKFLEPKMDVYSFVAEDILADSTLGGLPLPGEDETPIG